MAKRTSTAAHQRWAVEVRRNAAGLCQIRGPHCTELMDEADHIIPVAEGGPEHDPRNGQGACITCHAAKSKAEAARGRTRHYAQLRHPRERHPGLA